MCFPIGILIYSVTGILFKLYFIFYPLLIINLIKQVYTKGSLIKYNSTIIFSIIFLLYGTIFVGIITFLNGNTLWSIIFGFKQHFLYLIVFFTLVLLLNDIKDHIILFKYLIIATSINAFTTIFQFLNSIGKYSTKIISATNSYIDSANLPTSRWGTYLDFLGFERPLGLFLDLPSSSFFIQCGLISLLTVGFRSKNLVFSKSKTILLILVHVFSLLVHYSKINIFSFIFILIILFFMNRSLTKYNLYYSVKKYLKFTGLTFVFISLAVFIFFIEIFTESLITNIVFNFQGKAGIITGLTEIFKIESYNLDYFKMLFGIGYSVVNEYNWSNSIFNNSLNELHAIRMHIDDYGYIGFCLYISLYYLCVKNLLKSRKIFKKLKLADEFQLVTLGILISFATIISLLHYNVSVFGNVFFMGFVLSLTYFSKKRISHFSIIR